MSRRILPLEGERLAKQQSDEYLHVVGNSAKYSTDGIQGAGEVAMALQPMPFYLDFPDIRFIWELLDLGDQARKFRSIADAWIQSADNIERAEKYTGRSLRAHEYPFSGFAVFRMKARDGSNWSLLDDHGRKDKCDPNPKNPLPQTVVFIALTRLDPTNGFFMTLETGQDVCMDSRASIVYPPTGGGIGLAIWLRL